MPMHKDYRALWNAAGYGSKMGSAEVVPPPSPDVLRVYHLTSADHAIGDIALGRIKVARFADLNDPFELLSVNFHDAQMGRLVTEFKEQYGQRAGLLCFSQNWTSPVLWSHYGARHRGICLGFDVPRHQVREVRYEDIRSHVYPRNDIEPQVDRMLKDHLLSTKFSHWSYEREVRIVVPLDTATPEGKLYFRSFDDNLTLAEVILGPQCSLTLDAVRSVTSKLYPNVVVFGTRLAIKTFDIVPLEPTVP